MPIIMIKDDVKVSYHKLIKKVLALSVTQQIILGLVSGNVEQKVQL